jgi:lysine 2,3-aminomutase
MEFVLIPQNETQRLLKLSQIDPAVIEKDNYNILWNANPAIHEVLKTSLDLEDARESLFTYLFLREKSILNGDEQLHPLEKTIVLEAITVLKNIIALSSEEKAGVSNLEILFGLAKGCRGKTSITQGFLLEFVHLFKAISGLSGVYSQTSDRSEEAEPGKKEGRSAAIHRSENLDREERKIDTIVQNYPTGLQADVINDREINKQRILQYFNASEEDWQNYRWQMKHVIRKADVLKQLIDLTDDEESAIRIANANRIPFGITPYYVSLMDKEPSRRRDFSTRAQVIPPLHYSQTLSENRKQRSEKFDFMGEHDTSPIDLVTRRYPQIAIMKPYNTCAQICVYCQRNWEINQVLDPHAFASRRAIEDALQWFAEHPAVQEVLITGGDPLVMSDGKLDYILGRFAEIKHIQRIRIGTRMFVVLPQRFTDQLIEVIARYHELGKREVALVTHIEHVWEITPDTIQAVGKVRQKGLNVYNQAVYTFANSRRFELVTLRRQLRLAGIDPYYTFNAKGKDETREYRVPIARLLQERKEEARLMPGLDRTDEPVFNVPRLGKNHLRAGQDHQLLSILPNGRRVYEFLPWEKNIQLAATYIYTDVSIFAYLKMLQKRGENMNDYHSIWYYY